MMRRQARRPSSPQQGSVSSGGSLRERHLLLHGDMRDVSTDLLLGDELRHTVHSGLQSVGIVSAFMAALAGQCVPPPRQPPQPQQPRVSPPTPTPL